MQTIHVDLGERSYPVIIGQNLLSQVGALCKQYAGGRTAYLITNETIAPLYAQQVEGSLASSGYKVHTYILGDGEKTKSFPYYEALLKDMAEAGLTREDIVITLGGGVVGDLGGFAAASYMRGIKFVQVPTSLLAMVDSSVGGKVAIDLPQGKNLVGAFWQPECVLIDTMVLQTLSEDLFRDSMGEVIKYGVMCDAKLFEELEREPLHVSSPADRLERIIATCVEIKARIVSLDEKEAGMRALLNLGHTFGHAIEAESHFELGHGSSVAIGLNLMAAACEKKGRCDRASVSRIFELCAAHGLPTTSPYSLENLTPWLKSDKKRRGSSYKIVEVLGIGKTEVVKVSSTELVSMLDRALQ